MEGLKKCPCGKVPTDLSIHENGQGGKWKTVCGHCCGAWDIEFRAQYEGGDKLKALAVEAWNEAPRDF